MNDFAAAFGGGDSQGSFMPRRILRLVAVSTLALALGSQIAAAEGLFERDDARAGPYVAIFGGAAFLDDGEFSSTSGPVNFDASTGYNFGGAVGYQWPVRVLGVLRPRSEFEVNYFDSNLTPSGFNFAGGGVASGGQSGVSLLLNTYYDIKIAGSDRFTPNVGGGLGVVFLDQDAFQPAGIGAGAKFASSNDAGYFGHFAVGLTYAVNDRLDLYSEGRYVRSGNLDTDFTFPTAFTAADRLEGVSANAGLRWRF